MNNTQMNSTQNDLIAISNEINDLIIEINEINKKHASDLFRINERLIALKYQYEIEKINLLVETKEKGQSKMDNDIMNSVQVAHPIVNRDRDRVSFVNFDKVKHDCQEVANILSSIELTEDNIKIVKKDLANARKITDYLNSERITIKKDILQSYEEFASQIKELEAIIKGSENELRSQVNAIEQVERLAKDKKLNDYFSKQIQANELLSKLEWNTFRNDQWLNKSVSETKASNEINSKLAQILLDLNTINSMEDKANILKYYYLNGYNLAQAINTSIESNKVTDNELMTISIYKKDWDFIKSILQQNNINYFL